MASRPANSQAMTDLNLIDSHAGEVHPADVILVFGTRHWTAAEVAAELYFSDYAPVIVTTGGPKRHPRGASEAVQHQQLLLSAGVPAEAIIVESRSSTTTENVTMALPLIADSVSNVRSVIAVVKWCHRRAVVTLAAHAPWIERIYAADYEPFNAQKRVAATRSNWQDTYQERVERETRYMQERASNGLDLLKRTDSGWIRTV
jgi:DUF218 domain